MATNIKLIIVLTFVSSFAFGKTYPLDYSPQGNIIQLTFDNCILYTDSSSIFTAYKSICTITINRRKCFFILTYQDFCKSIRTIIKNNDTLNIDIRTNNNTDTLITSFFFPSIARELIEMNKARLYSVNEKQFVTLVKIKTRTKKRKSWQTKTITTKKTNNFLLAYKIEDETWFD